MDTETNTNNGHNDDTGTSENNSQAEAKTFTQEEVNAMMATQKGNVEKKFTKLFDGVDVAEYNQLKDAQATAIRKEQIKKGEFDKIMEETTSKHNTVISQLQSKIAELTINTPIINAAAQLKAVNPEQVHSLLKGEFRLGDSGDVEVLDGEGKARYNDDGKPFSVSDRVREFLDSNPHFVSPTPATGNTQSNTQGKVANNLDISSLDMTNSKHRELYKKMKANG